MLYQRLSCAFLSTLLLAPLCLSVFFRASGQEGTAPPQTESRERRPTEPAQQSTPTLKRSGRREKSKDQDDEVVTIETDLANVLSSFWIVVVNRLFLSTAVNRTFARSVSIVTTSSSWSFDFSLLPERLRVGVDC